MSTANIDLADLFETLPMTATPRFTEPQSTGVCWFKNHEGYPDSGHETVK
jgi:hypothetical protein